MLVVKLHVLYFMHYMFNSEDVVLTDAGFIHPPVRSEPSTWRVTFDRLEIQVFMKKLPGICLESPSEMITIMNVKHPSVRAPRWMSTFSFGPRPMSGNVSRMSLTPVIDPSTLTVKREGKNINSTSIKMEGLRKGNQIIDTAIMNLLRCEHN